MEIAMAKAFEKRLPSARVIWLERSFRESRLFARRRQDRPRHGGRLCLHVAEPADALMSIGWSAALLFNGT
jgi:hypothetical protein